MPQPTRPMGILKAYHKEALAALEGDDSQMQPRKRLQQLDTMKGSIRNLPMFREVFVANAAIAKSRAAAANKQMKNLRDAYHSKGQDEKYEMFESRLNDYLGPRNFTPHGFLDRDLADADEAVIYNGIHKLMDVLTGFGYAGFVNSGTLLGLVRNKGLIPYDDDIDLAILLDAKTDEQAAEEFKILLGMLLDHGLDCYFVEGRQIIIKLPDVDGFQVDLFPAYGTPDKLNIYPYARESLTRDDLSPMQTCPVSGLPLPARPEVLLEQNYGEDWVTPDPRFVFPWVKQKEVFKSLLDNMVQDV